METFEPSKEMLMNDRLNAAKQQRNTRIYAVGAILMTGIVGLAIWLLFEFGQS